MQILADRIFVIENFLSEETCDYLINSFSDKLIENPKWTKDAGDYAAGSSEDFWKEGVYGGPAFTESYRKAELSATNKILKEESLANDLLTGIGLLQEKTVAQIFKKDIYIKHMFYCHMETGAKNALHHDNWLDDQVDDHSGLLYLTDDYEGGRIEFPEHGISLKPKRGTFICFIGDDTLPHQVTEITSGKRINLISFYSVRS